MIKFLMLACVLLSGCYYPTYYADEESGLCYAVQNDPVVHRHLVKEMPCPEMRAKQHHREAK